MSRLQLIEEVDDDPQMERVSPPAPQSANEPENSKIATDLLLLALAALSKRTVVALAACQTLIAIGTVLFLSYKILSAPTPSIVTVTGTAVYAVFVLVALWLSKRR